MSSREQFETAYSELMGTPASVLKNLRDGDEYRETEGHRMQVAWLMWQAASKASEQQLAAVVAENAGLKGFGKTLSEMHEGLNGSGTGIQGEYEATCQQVALDAAMDAFDEIKTPATDAFLAEVRAQGVEMFVSHMDYPHSPYEFTHGYMDKHAIDFAAQLRQGAAL